MIRREVPEPISKKQAAIPAVLGLLSVFLATMLMIGFGAGIKALFGSVSEAVSSLVLRSLVSSFFLAGFTEEVVKLLMFLVAIKIVKPKNVYEYGLLCAGVGFGFTALEEFIYAGSSLVAMVLRIFYFAMHMVFGLLMGLHLGLESTAGCRDAAVPGSMCSWLSSCRFYGTPCLTRRRPPTPPSIPMTRA